MFLFVLHKNKSIILIDKKNVSTAQFVEDIISNMQFTILIRIIGFVFIFEILNILFSKDKI